jgi:hypothetical protein
MELLTALIADQSFTQSLRRLENETRIVDDLIGHTRDGLGPTHFLLKFFALEIRIIQALQLLEKMVI